MGIFKFFIMQPSLIKICLRKESLALILSIICCGSSIDAATVGKPGYFHLTQRNSVWMFIDPEGKPVYLRGLNHYGDGSHMPWNLEEKYGSVEAWQKDLPNRLEAWGFNFLPTSIGPAAIDPGSLSPEAFAADKKTSGNELVTRTRD